MPFEAFELPMVREAEMGLWNGKAMADHFAAYIGELTKVVGHADRAGPLRDYCSGLLATEGRRSVEPMAAVTAPAQVSAQHQKLLHFVANSTWSDEEMLAKVSELVTPAIERHGAIKLDHRRYIVPEERSAFGWGASSILRP